MFEQGVENVLIVLFGKKIGDGCSPTAANPSILLLSARASEPSKAAVGSPGTELEFAL